MTPRAVVRRAVADDDVEAIVDFHLGEAGADVALAFIDRLDQALSHIARHPGTGSPRHAEYLGVPGLRCWPLTRFPYLVFYFERADDIDVWRVLPQAADAPNWLI